MLITLGSRRAAEIGTLHDVTWPAFVEWLKSHPRGQSVAQGARYEELARAPASSPEGRELASQKDGPWVAFAAFEGNHRHLKHNPRGCAIPVDIDHTDLTPQDIGDILRGYAWCAYTTFGHTAAHPRWRIIVPLSGETDAATHRATWMALNERFGNTADVAAKDITRLNYLPGACIDPAAALCISGDGQLFPVVPAPPDTASAPSAAQGEGPVDGWCGPLDDTELLAAAFTIRTRPEERFNGGPVLLEQLWRGDEAALGERYPAKEPGQAWDHTRADLALLNELMYFTGRDAERSMRLALQAECVSYRGEPEDEMRRKLSYALRRASEREEVYDWPASLDRTDAAVPAGTNPPSAPLQAGITPSASNVDGASPVPAAPVGLIPATPAPAERLLHPEDFYAYLKEHKYVYRPTRELWTAASLGAELRALIDIERPVHRLTWAPGQPERFRASDWDAADELGASTWYYNLYNPPRRHTRAGDIGPWMALLLRLYPNDARHIVQWIADRVQNPGRKINHALVLGSRVHGVGKDTLLAPVQYAVGEVNYTNISPARVLSRFNGYRQSVVCQISESRNIGEEQGAKVDRYAFYEAMKDLSAAPPSRLEVDTKNIKEYWVANIVGPVITTNHYTDGLYVPPEDRRLYCAWSTADKATEELAGLWKWYGAGGLDAVACYLQHVDLTGWDRTAPPPHTEWWHELVGNGAAIEAAGLEDAVEALGNPESLTIVALSAAADNETRGWLAHPSSAKKIAHRLSSLGYAKHRNPNEKRGRWLINGVRAVVYRR